jgi:hypothetical protein
MKSFFAIVAIAMASIHASDPEEVVHQETSGNPAKTTSMALIMTEEGYDKEFTELVESRSHRHLQNDSNVGTSAVNVSTVVPTGNLTSSGNASTVPAASGESSIPAPAATTPQPSAMPSAMPSSEIGVGAGFGNDPDACQAVGVRLECISPNEFSDGENVTQIVNTIKCDLNDQKTLDFQSSQNCVCNAYLEQPIASTSQMRIRNCSCAVCPKGSPKAVSLDCSVVVEDPYLVGTECTTIDCDGRCDGGGFSFLAQTAAPSVSAAVTTKKTEMASAIFGALISFVVAWIIE